MDYTQLGTFVGCGAFAGLCSALVFNLRFFFRYFLPKNAKKRKKYLPFIGFLISVYVLVGTFFGIVGGLAIGALDILITALTFLKNTNEIVTALLFASVACFLLTRVDFEQFIPKKWKPKPDNASSQKKNKSKKKRARHEDIMDAIEEDLR